MYLINGKYYLTFEELDHLEEKFIGKKDILHLEGPITEEYLEEFLEHAVKIKSPDVGTPIEFLFYLREMIEENDVLYRTYKKKLNIIDKVINHHVEVMEKEDLEEFLRTKGKEKKS